MQTTISKWGNSLAIRIPAALAKELGLKEGKHAVIKPHGDSFSVLLPKKRKYTLKELSDSIASVDEAHQEMDWGRPVGREVW